MSNSKHTRKFTPALLVIILVFSLIGTYFTQFDLDSKQDLNSFVGIAFCGNTTAQAKLLIDRTKTYTNLFILNSGRNPLSGNQTSVEEICDYAVVNGLSVIINIGINDFESAGNTWFWQTPIESINYRWTERWGDKFIGIYYNDEPGGIQLDGHWREWFTQYGDDLEKINHPATYALNNIYLKMYDSLLNGSIPQDYDSEADFFIQNVLIDDPGLAALKTAEIRTFTSDYGLYWFDYLGGYDVLLMQVGWNLSLVQQIASVKGAARLQNKEWGAIITWKYMVPPYLDTGDQIYNQMLTSYQAGAKYIIIFNYPIIEGNPYGLMTDEHFGALERFWNDVNNKNFPDLSKADAVLVLPKNYGWGMRHPDDTIWGFWPADHKSYELGIMMSKLLAKYGASLDIVYEDDNYSIANANYQNMYFWNSTEV
jgi:hypothetical protein